jgi:hypothetical protein
VLRRATEIAIERETQLCSAPDGKERDQLIDLLQKLQPGLIERPGVHPGLGKDHPGPREK